jgi:tRNA(fMet)-specific endonuclease VapC
MDTPATKGATAGDGQVSFLLDTDICSAQMRANGRVQSRFVQYGGRLYISTVTLAELYAWALRARASPKRMPTLLNLLKEVQVVVVDETVARKFGEVRAWQLDHGVGSPELDLLNGAVALVHNFTMVTHNGQDYANIPTLTIDDWLAP